MILSNHVSHKLSLRGIVAVIGVALVTLFGCSQGQSLPQQVLDTEKSALRQAANVQPKTPETSVTRVTISNPVRRDFIPFQDFIGRLVAVEPGDPHAATLPEMSIAVLFDMDESSFLSYQRMLRSGQVKERGDVLSVGLSDEIDFPRAGTLDYFDNEINTKTGTIGGHGVLPNPDQFLLPGMFARVRMNFGPPRSVLEVPGEAVNLEDGQSYLWVSDGNIVDRRKVRTGALDGKMRVIEEGLRQEDLVVIAGANGLKPGDHIESLLNQPPRNIE
ncbi:MAG: family efflux transporter, subunit [Schlesneria sp.]|nr:family efflux transporter, subunit [Schlesneria sp.]